MCIHAPRSMTKITRVGDAGVQMTTNPMARVVTAGGVKATAAAVPAAMATTGGGGGEGGWWWCPRRQRGMA